MPIQYYPFANINPVLHAVSGSQDTFSIPNAEVGSIYLMFHASPTGNYHFEQGGVVGHWGIAAKNDYSVSGGELIEVFDRYIGSDFPYFTKMIFVRATTTNVTVTSAYDVLSRYDRPSDCVAIKLC